VWGGGGPGAVGVDSVFDEGRARLDVLLHVREADLCCFDRKTSQSPIMANNVLPYT